VLTRFLKVEKELRAHFSYEIVIWLIYEYAFEFTKKSWLCIFLKENTIL